MYYPDFTEYTPLRNHPLQPYTFKEVLTIGWLEKGHDYSIGKVHEVFIAKLKDLLISPQHNINLTRGIHQCDFCVPSSDPFFTYKIFHNEKDIALGMSELWVPSENGLIYAAPTLIYHYITEHSYRPPEKFVEAVIQFDLNSDWNGREVYLTLVKKYRSSISDSQGNL